MRPHVLNRLIIWLLPLLIARLFVPEGFMVEAGAQGLSLILCPSYVSVPGMADSMHMQHAGMDHSAHAMQGDVSPAMHHHHGSHDKAPCPFALAASGLVSPIVGVAAPIYALTDRLAIVPADPAWTAPAVLIDRIRGPPFA